MAHTYIDLFAGCGGLSLGLYNSGWKGLFAIEKGVDSFSTLKYNLIDKLHHMDWPKDIPQKNYDINQFLVEYKSQLYELIDKVDLIAGGPPCQGFSMAGRRQEEDIRNNLVYSYIEFIKIIRPKLIFFENVKGFTLEFKKNKGKGVKYSTLVLEALEKNGYDVIGKIVDFSNYGIPQRRKRFILVGVKKDLNLKSKVELFFDKLSANSETFLNKKNLPIKTNLSDAISDLLKVNGEISSPDSNLFSAGVYGNVTTPYQFFIKKGITLNYPDSHRFAKHSLEIESKFLAILEEPEKNKSVSQDIRNRFNIKKHRVVPLDKNDVCPTLTTLPDDIIHYSEPRILTVREYARIQTFPDWFEFKGKYTTGGKRRVIEVPRYTQIGNAVPPLFSEQCGILLNELLLNNEKI